MYVCMHGPQGRFTVEISRVFRPFSLSVSQIHNLQLNLKYNALIPNLRVVELHKLISFNFLLPILFVWLQLELGTWTRSHKQGNNILMIWGFLISFLKQGLRTWWCVMLEWWSMSCWPQREGKVFTLMEYLTIMKSIMSDTCVVYDRKQILLNLRPDKAMNLIVQAPVSEFAFLTVHAPS